MGQSLKNNMTDMSVDQNWRFPVYSGISFADCPLVADIKCQANTHYESIINSTLLYTCFLKNSST